MKNKDLIKRLRELDPETEIYVFESREKVFEPICDITECSDYVIWTHANVPREGYVIY